MASPTTRTMEALRKEGWTPAIVERFNPHVGAINPATGRPIGIRQDLWGFADIIAVKARETMRLDNGKTIVMKEGVFLLVQTTSLGNISSRVNKIRALPAAAAWLAAGGRIEVWGWSNRTGKWLSKRLDIQDTDMDPVVLLNLPKKRKRDKFVPGDLF